MTSTLTPATMKPLVLYGSLLGPNPAKVGMVLRSLGLPFEIKEVGFGDVKKEPYVSVNPIGRLPSLYDPNSDITIVGPYCSNITLSILPRLSLLFGTKH